MKYMFYTIDMRFWLFQRYYMLLALKIIQQYCETISLKWKTFGYILEGM